MLRDRKPHAQADVVRRQRRVEIARGRTRGGVVPRLSLATQAALEAGFVRLRPVLMTALAMVIGMLPMALGFGEGGEQNAPLGRAVIGGLIFATVSTLFFVPVVFSIIHRNYRALPEQEPGFGEAHVPA